MEHEVSIAIRHTNSCSLEMLSQRHGDTKDRRSWATSVLTVERRTGVTEEVDGTDLATLSFSFVGEMFNDFVDMLR